MGKMPLFLAWALTLLAALFQGACFSSLHINAFAPLLAILSYRFSLTKALWTACFCGIIMDCISSDIHFGLYSCIFVFVEALAFWQKQNFFEDKAFAFIVFSILLAMITTLSQRTIVNLLGSPIPNSGLTMASEFLGGSLIDAAYTLIWFVFPATLHSYIKKAGGWRNLFRRKSIETDEA